MEYNHKDIEQKWQDKWRADGTYKVTEDTTKPKYYVLDMFPYPSGAGLHVGHPLGYIATDILSRYKRLKGFNVLHPMGVDAFGLPAEQYAIQTGNHPGKFTDQNIEVFKKQLDAIGFDYDWDRMVKTSDPRYYKWTQWIFMQLFNSWYNVDANKAEGIETLVAKFEQGGSATANAASGEVEAFTAEQWKCFSEKEQQDILMEYRLAYQSYSDVNWCPELGTVLANDEVQNGYSVRGGHPVVKKPMRQWYLRITAYADRLLDGLNSIDWPESLKEQQRNWIGRSEGAKVFFPIKGSEEQIEIFTTRPDTIFGATFMVLAPEHPLVQQITTDEYKEDIDKYLEYAQSRSDLDRQQEVKKVTGAFTGAYAVNPFTGNEIPIWIGEYVLMGYGTGAIMAVPADDERDQRFAEKFNIPIIDVIDRSEYPNATIQDKVGKLINSGFLNGMEVLDAIEAILTEIEKQGIGERKVNYRQRDAGFSRQRYWGEPFPVVYDKQGIARLLPESELPLELPEVESYQPTGDGRSPLSTVTDWVQTPQGERETDTMPGYAGSSWYFLRYMDPHNPEAFAGKEALDYWQNVDFYMGGAEHAVGHLLYSRFWHKFLYDTGYVTTEEPFKKMVNQGMIQGVSSYFYRVNYRSSVTTSADFDSPNVPNVLVSKEIALRVIEGNPTESDLEKIDSAIENAKSEWISGGQLEFNSNSLSKILVGINLVDKDNYLDIEGFKSLWGNGEYKNAIFVLNEQDKFLCDDEVEKMSKSKYNTVDPLSIIEKYGADTFRMYEMFLGPIELSKPWNTQGIDGVGKFVKKLWRLFYDGDTSLLTDAEPTKDELKVLHRTIKKIEDDVERLSFNTCISGFMICVNELTDLDCHKKAVLKDLVVLLAPFAPHLAEELWHEALGETTTVVYAPFPQFKPEYLVESTHTYPVSINGKVRAQVELDLNIEKDSVQATVLELDAIQKWLEGKEVKRFIYVPKKIINIVV